MLLVLRVVSVLSTAAVAEALTLLKIVPCVVADDSHVCIEQHGTAQSTGCAADPSQDASSQWRVRRATYNPLGQLVSASNPETGTITYAYDADGNNTQKTAPAANQPAGSSLTVTTQYSYDQLNRVTTVSFSTGEPSIAYTYDSGTNAIGQLVGAAGGWGSYAWSYDALGRVTTRSETILGITETFRYTYNLAGGPATVQYPNGLVLTYAVDENGSVTGITDQTGRSYVANVVYGPAGKITSLDTAAIHHTFTYDNQLEPVRIQAVTTSATGAQTPLLDLSYNFHHGAGANGNVYGITNNKDTSRNQSFSYDHLNRLLSAANAGSDCSVMLPDGNTKFWGQSFAYDAWGNLTQLQATKCSAEHFTAQVTGKNQYAGFVYDAAGNLTTVPPAGGTAEPASFSVVYDGENRVSQVRGETYVYDESGRRVAKTNGTDGTIY
jgi:YD repeat-containing protein